MKQLGKCHLANCCSTTAFIVELKTETRQKSFGMILNFFPLKCDQIPTLFVQYLTICNNQNVPTA